MNESSGGDNPDSLPPGSFAITLFVDDVSTGIFTKRQFASYSGKTLVKLAASDEIEKVHRVSMNKIFIGPRGQYVGGGCYSYVVVDFRKAGNLTGGSWAGLCNAPLVTTLVLEGTGTAHRVAGYPWNGFQQCGGLGQPTCFDYGKQHKVQLTPTSQKLELLVDSSSVMSGSTVRFTARRTDGGAFTVQSWTWKPMTRVSNAGTTTASTYGPSAGGCSVGNPICDAMMTNTETVDDTTASAQRGIMFVRALVNGITETAKAEVTVKRGQLRLAVDPGEVFVADTAVFTPSTVGGQPFRVLVWAWVPDTLPGHSSGCGTADSVCRAPIFESGVMHLTAEVGGRNERATARVKAKPNRVEIVPAASEVAPASAGLTGTSTLVSVSVTGGDGQPVPNATVNLTLIADYTSAGHSGPQPHTGPKPTGTIPASVMTGPTGVTTVTYSASRFSGPVTIEGTSTGVKKGTATIRVRVAGLAELQFNSAMLPTGRTDWHTSNHWGTPAMNDALQRLANELQRVRAQINALPPEDRPAGTFPAQFGVNDMSLVDGGKFDLNHAWGPDWTSHEEHRRGQEADVRVQGTPEWDYYATVVQTYWELTLGGDVHDERATEEPHFHLRLRK